MNWRFMHDLQTALFTALTAKNNVGEIRIARCFQCAHYCLMGRLGIGIDVHLRTIF
jgi:hypothetical protein